MKKTFQLRAPGKDPQRVLALVKSDVGRYLNREKRKPFPAGFDLWTFTCKVGPDAATAEAKDVKEVGAAIDTIAATEATSVYVEILAVPGNRPKKIDPLAPPVAGVATETAPEPAPSTPPSPSSEETSPGGTH